MAVQLQSQHILRLLFKTVIIVKILMQVSSGNEDPCQTAISLSNPSRSTTEDPGTCGGLCDNYIVDGWYRLDTPNAPARMPESCVPVGHCGTYIPIWLNGPHPTAANPGPIKIPVCAKLRNSGDCCEWRDVTWVMRCNGKPYEYFVYWLKNVPFCAMAYCAGSAINCGPSAAWNDISGNCTSPQYPSLDANPQLDGPYTSLSKDVTDINGKQFTATKFSMKCKLGFTKRQVDDGARYDVIFQAGNDIVFTQTLKSTDVPEVEMSETFLSGQNLDKILVCKVNSYWQSSYPIRTDFKTSNSFYFGVQIKNVATKSEIAGSFTLRQGESISLTFSTTFPITTPSCLTANGLPCFPYYTFRIYSGGLLISTCTFQLANTYVTPQSIVISPSISNVFWPYSGSGSFYIVADDSNSQTQNSIFNGYTSKTYQVAITGRYLVTCISWGDPHITTFSGNYYHHYYLSHLPLLGQFVLVSVPSKKKKVPTAALR